MPITRKKLIRLQKSELEGERKVPNVLPESNESRNQLLFTPEQASLIELKKIRELLEDIKNNQKRALLT